MRKIIAWIFTLFCFQLSSQEKLNKMVELFKNIENLSQNSNLNIYNSHEYRTFISSTDGLNIYDGTRSKVYRPSTHHMFGFNIQSSFFEDTTGKVWFTTYEALNYYDPRKDNLDYTFMVTSGDDTIKDNYKAFALDQNKLFLKAGKEVFVYDVYSGSILSRYSIDLSHIFELSVMEEGEDYLLFAGAPNHYSVFRLKGEQFTLLDQGSHDVSSVSNEGLFWWLGDKKGKLSLYDPKQKQFTDSFIATPFPIISIGKLSDTKLIVSCGTDELYVVDLNLRKVVQQIQVTSSVSGSQVSRLINPYVDADSTLWIGADGQGVFFRNLKKQKLDHFLVGEQGSNTYSITKILPYQNEAFIVLTRRHGIFWIDADGRIRQQWNKLPGGKIDFTARNGVWMKEDVLLFSVVSELYELDISTGIIEHLQKDFANKEVQYEEIDILSNGKIIASCDNLLLNDVKINGNKFKLVAYGEFDHQTNSTTYFKEDQSGHLYVSNDERTVLVLKLSSDKSTHIYDYSLPIQGGVWSIFDDSRHNLIYLSNTQGLFQINKSSHQFRQIKDKDLLLVQTIYSVLADKDDNLWLGTNKGLMKYYPANNAVKVFSEMDGIQALEYNSHAYLKTEDGHMLFGGVNGLNYFNPDEVIFSEKLAPIYLDEIKINDEPDTLYRVPQYKNEINLTYARNTFSIDFHAIDYSDPDATRVLYKLVGVDKDYIESKTAQGFARYANLRPGHYTFSILGRNSDGVLNQESRNINVIIRPPFWQTWWFLTISTLAIASIIFWTFKSYYRRKLEKKNQLLREQSLIIEKQQAVEQERTRIASEMHDDLGSGLTTIRYLSDKALKQAKDAEEAGQIKRIADHSNALVRNMSEIIWAMNSRFDNTQNLSGYLRRYASEFLDEHQLPLTFEDDGGSEGISIGGEKRRNIFLVFKELLNNSVKYSKAESIRIRITNGENYIIKIAEVNALGFDPESLIDKGNGLFNCRKRMNSIDGGITFERTDIAMNIIISAPLNSGKVG